MFAQLLKSAVRSILRHKMLAGTILCGLILGLFSSAILFSYVLDQFSYDKFLPDASRIYRVTSAFKRWGGGQQTARCYANWIRELKHDFPEVEQETKFIAPGVSAIQVDDKISGGDNFFLADSTFFEVFPLKFVIGDRENALHGSNSIVLSLSTSRSLFGASDPTGRSVTVTDRLSGTHTYQITGVFDDVPANAHFHPSSIATWPTRDVRDGMGYYYLLLRPGSSPEAIEHKLPAFIASHTDADEAKELSLHLQALTDIHLKSHLLREFEENGDATYASILLAVAIAILIVTSINHINLMTAGKVATLKDIGIRKVLGENVQQTSLRNILESGVYVLVSFGVSLVAMEILLPWAGGILPVNVAGEIPRGVRVLGLLGLESLFLALIGGAIVAMRTRQLSPAQMFTAGNVLSLRWSRPASPFSGRALILAQFAVAVFLICFVATVVRQMQLVTHTNLGYRTEQTIALRNIPYQVRDRYDVFKKEASRQADIVGVSCAMQEPSSEIVDAGLLHSEGKTDPQHPLSLKVLPVDRNFIEFMHMKLVAGESFLHRVTDNFGATPAKTFQDVKRHFETANRVYILNESAVKTIGWQNAQEAIGKPVGIRQGDQQLKDGPVIGVVRDFHFSSLHRRIDPMVLFIEPYWINTILVRLAPGRVTESLQDVREVWNSVNPDFPFTYTFLDDAFAARYRGDRQFESLLLSFSGVAILIACLGLFGISAFVFERRIKEIGIRKVLGGSVVSIIALLTNEFLKWILIADLIAWPAAYVVTEQWLQSFAYRVQIGWLPFLVSGIIVLLVSVATAGSQAFRTALSNPIDALRHE